MGFTLTGPDASKFEISGRNIVTKASSLTTGVPTGGYGFSVTSTSGTNSVSNEFRVFQQCDKLTLNPNAPTSLSDTW